MNVGVGEIRGPAPACPWRVSFSRDPRQSDFCGTDTDDS